ncbi:ABC-F family ATP-binding cassette domain-containing protein [Bacteriovoracaceae bacterium]|nr:ABC-F family ATP-binding cassette domain-containing protein [Bacteriovoracaceae bacterium]
MLQLKNISKSYGTRVLFDDVNINFSPKNRVGLVGRNGTGKSTLFKIILGSETSDTGSVAIPKGYRLGSLNQHIKFTKESVLDEVMKVLPKELEFETYRAEKILFGLGFDDEMTMKDPRDFSGGYQVRIELAKTLVQEPNLLLLDEPTNYLDIVSLRWLERFLINFDGEVILITHDRSFMDAVCTHVMGIHRGKVRKLKGDTHNFYFQIAQDEEIYEKTRLNQDKKKKEIQQFIDKFKAKASKARQAQSKEKLIEKMESMDKLEEIPEFGFSFKYQDCPSKVLAEFNNLEFGYDENLLFSNISLHLAKGDRVGIIGKNGKGKSTILNLMNHYLKSESSEIKYHAVAKVGHFGQTNIERLHLKNSIEQEVFATNEKLSRTEVRSICGSMMFPGDDALKKISVLSGGEKSRVMLGKILATPVNILYLDEPTNHLDMESVETLTNEIEDFEGAAVFVTHNEFMLRKLATKLIIFHKGVAEVFDGNYDEFLEKVGWEEEIDLSKKVKEKPVAPKTPAKNNSNFNKQKIEMSIEEKENKIVELEAMIEKFQKMIDTKASKGEDFSELTITLSKLSDKVEEEFEALANLSEQLN